MLQPTPTLRGRRPGQDITPGDSHGGQDSSCIHLHARSAATVAYIPSLPHHDRVPTWLRRSGVTLLAIAFAGALAATLTLQAANSTLARPGFLADQLERAEVYRFVMDDLLAAVVEDTRRLDAGEMGGEFDENLLTASGLTTEQITSAVQRAVSPGDLEALAAPAVAALGEYITGEQDETTFMVDADAQLDALVGALTDLLRESGAYGRLLERELTPKFAEWADEEFPPAGDESGWVEFLRGGNAGAGGSLVRVFTRVVTPEWVAGQVERGGDELIGYLTGRSEGFELRIEPGVAQAREAAREIEAIIAEADAYDVAYATVIEPTAEGRLDPLSELPYGLVLTRADILASLRRAASPTWVGRQAAMLAGEVSAYVTGQSEGFTAVFDLVPLKGDAARALTATATAALRERLQILPECSTPAEMETAREAIRRELPHCLPPGATVVEFVGAAAPVLASSIEESVLDRVPNEVRYTEEDLRDGLEQDGGVEALTALDDIRGLFSEGWSYSDQDLRADLSDNEGAIELVEDIRSLLSDGYVVEASSESREWVDWARRGRWVGGLVAGILLLGVALLGGTSWRGRVAWAAAVVVVSGGLIALAAGPAYLAASGALFDAIREGLAPAPGSRFALTSELLVNKLLEIIERATNDVAGDIARSSLVVAIVAAVPLVAALFGKRVVSAARRGQSSPS